MQVFSFCLVAFAGLAGVLGIAEAAAAAHLSANPLLALASNFLLLHAGASLALLALGKAVPRHQSLYISAAAILLAGLSLFCGDLSSQVFAHARLFPFAAPIGGSLLILGWIIVALSGLLSALSKPAAPA